jgi:hypothetical protein
MKKELRGVVIGIGLTLGALAVAQSVQRTLNVLVNGQPNADKAIVVNNTSYVPARVLRNFGVTVTAQGNNLLLNGAGGSSGTVSSNPVSSNPAPNTNTGAAGTTQLAGTSGQLNTAYTLGKASPINFNLVSARYSIDPINIQGPTNEIYSAESSEKLLVLRFVVQNPAPRDVEVNYRTFGLTAVDEKDVNHKFESYFARVGESDEYAVNLKPSQRVELVAVQKIPANVRIVKLLVESKLENGAPIVRYDLSGKVTPLPAPYSSDGFSALPQVAAQIGQSYVLQNFSAKVEQIAFSNAQIEGRTPDEGKRFLVATISLKNLTTRSTLNVDYNTILSGLEDADGGTRGNENYLVRPSNGEVFSAQVRPGAEVRFNAYYQVDNGVGFKTFTLREGATGRVFTYDISSLR